MKALIVILSAPIVMVLLLGTLQTIEWFQDAGFPIPWQVYALLAVSFVWLLAAIKVSQAEDWKKASRFFDKLTDEKKKTNK